jgi:hypothetical protein
MSQSSVDLITALHTQWMQTNHTLEKSRALLQDIEDQMEEAWRVFHIELKAIEDEKMRDQEQATIGISDHEAINSGMFLHDEEDIPSAKESARSARIQARRPLIGNKSSGGFARIVKSENNNKHFKTTVTQGGEDVYTRPDQHSQRVGGKVRGKSPKKDFHYHFAEEPEQNCNVYTSFAFKKQRKEEKKNKSQRDIIFIE